MAARFYLALDILGIVNLIAISITEVSYSSKEKTVSCSVIHYSKIGNSPRGSMQIASQTDRLTMHSQNKFINSSMSSNLHGGGTQTPTLSPSIALMSMSVTGAGSSSMIEREKRAIEKIKAKQKKDVEQMMEYELQLEQIR